MYTYTYTYTIWSIRLKVIYNIHIYTQNTPVNIWPNCNTNNDNFNNDFNDNQVKQTFLDIYRKRQI